MAPTLQRTCGCPGTDGDDGPTASCAHHGQCGAHPVEYPFQIDVDNLAPGIGVHLLQTRYGLDHAGVPDQNVETAEPIAGHCNGGLHFAIP